MGNYNKCSLGVSLALAFAADFPREHNAMKRGPKGDLTLFSYMK